MGGENHIGVLMQSFRGEDDDFPAMGAVVSLTKVLQAIGRLSKMLSDQSPG